LSIIFYDDFIELFEQRCVRALPHSTELSWPANAGHPGDAFSSLSKNIVMARRVRATHGSLLRLRKIAVGRPHKAGDDDFVLEIIEDRTWVARS
jgi:hypothetical protein